MRQILGPIVGLFVMIGSAGAYAGQPYQVIGHFGGPIESTPVADKKGNLYIVSSSGKGGILELTPGNGTGLWKKAMIYSFRGASDGSMPNPNLAIDKSGNLYGTTHGDGDGGKSSDGTVFRLSPPTSATGKWALSTIYKFDFLTSGIWPDTGVLIDKSGALYGTTSFYVGTGLGEYSGTVFKLAPSPRANTPWRYSLIHHFSPDSQHFFSGSELIMDSAGALYGSDVSGGPKGNGTLFELVPPAKGKTAWTEIRLHVFGSQAHDGIYPRGKIVLDSSGAVYGTTEKLAPTGCGNAFKLTPPKGIAKNWTETILYQFQGPVSGCVAMGGLAIDSFGNLIGMTYEGGNIVDSEGALLALSPPAKAGGKWKGTILHTFLGETDGSAPEGAPLILKNVAYGTTETTAFKYSLK